MIVSLQSFVPYFEEEEWIQGKTGERIETRRGVKQRISSTQSERVRDQLRRKYSELDREMKKNYETRQEKTRRETSGGGRSSGWKTRSEDPI